MQIFNGWDPIPANLLWQGNMNGDMAGWSVNTTNNNHQMLLRIVSNSAYSCATGEAFPPLHWVMQCGTVGIGENMGPDFSMYPNPTTGELSLQLPSIAHGPVDMRVVIYPTLRSPRDIHQHGWREDSIWRNSKAVTTW